MGSGKGFVPQFNKLPKLHAVQPKQQHFVTSQGFNPVLCFTKTLWGPGYLPFISPSLTQIYLWYHCIIATHIFVLFTLKCILWKKKRWADLWKCHLRFHCIYFSKQNTALNTRAGCFKGVWGSNGGMVRSAYVNARGVQVLFKIPQLATQPPLTTSGSWALTSL